MRTSIKSFCLAGALAVAALFMTSNESQAQRYGGGYGSRGVQGGYGGYGRGGVQGFNSSYSNRGLSFGYSSGYRYRSGPIYHAPSVHYDRVYHADTLHWTPRRGLHTHGHYHVVPHYTPGHYDYRHRGHIHANPYYHR